MHRRFQLGLLVATWVLLALSFVGAEHLVHQPLHHVPTVIALVILGRLSRNPGRLSDASMTAIVLFLWLHILGARWIYSFVPYDDWSRAWFGSSITEAFHFERNHYDRLVHFLYGVLAMGPLVEILRRAFRMRRTPAVFLSLLLVLGTGALYEIVEWLLALVMSPEHAESYNGQQGDPLDAHRDMACAAVGALLSGIVLLFVRRRDPDGANGRP